MAKSPAELDREIAEALAEPADPTPEPRSAEVLEQMIAGLRKKVFRLQGQARKTWKTNIFGERGIGVPADTIPGYIEAVDRIKVLRKELRKALRRRG